MKQEEGLIRLSATDLVGHLACRHLTALDRAAASGALEPPSNWSPFLDILRERGFAHEQAYFKTLESRGRVVRIEGAGVERAHVASTLAAMRDGADFIVQAALSDGTWEGRADVLRRVEMTTQLGSWGYEVIDTKLARETKAGTILQLCLYSDLVAQIQGASAEYMYVVTPWSGLEAEAYRTSEFMAYHRFVRRRLERSVAREAGDTYPEPKPHCEICRWNRTCDERRRGDDHPCLVAGISKLQIAELKERAVLTMLAISRMDLPLPWKPGRGAARTYERVREQARVQVEGREKKRPVYEPLPAEPGFGLSRLPEPSPGDVFLDFEGDPFAGMTGLEYLFGYAALGENGALHYRGNWALTQEEEKRAFEGLVDWIIERWRRFPDMHIYHYAPYEPAAMKRLVGRHATREDEVDRMLRGGLFVDLYQVVRHGIRASVESYSIKELEQFYRFAREIPLSRANGALARLQASLELHGTETIRDEDRKVVEAYNRDDCASARALRDWLEDIRSRLIAGGTAMARPAPSESQASPKVSDWAARVSAVHARLTEGVPIDASQRTGEEQARWVLANSLDWHRREEKSEWWEYFRLEALSADELLEERKAISGLRFLESAGGTANCPIHRYSFPAQEAELRGDEELVRVGGAKFGTLVAIDADSRTIDIKKRKATATVHAEAVFAHKIVDATPLKESLLALGEEIAASGLSNADNKPARKLLLRCVPDLGGEKMRMPAEAPLAAALRLCNKLEGNVLAIQGPPGAGKTFTAARMICKLVRDGRRVGITALSHKVIRNLLNETFDAAREMGLTLEAIQKIKDDESADDARAGADGAEHAQLTLTKDNDAVFAAFDDGVKVAAGTAWLWALPKARQCVDVLFADEAAQMSLANVLAVSKAAKALVLLGDPQQLEQPLKGSHPEGTDVSALAHILAGRQTIGAEQGLFLDQTWRLHPEICAFTSEMFYEGKLTPVDGLAQQRVLCDGPLAGSGLRYFPVHHSGNQSASPEEAELIARLVRQLLAGNARWIDQKGRKSALTLHDVLIIAPYNAQVFALKDRLAEVGLPNARIGTVDKFQGQEAPITIYSMATSAPDDAPRGMEFLYSLNRLNVATSRARCVSALVASPDLFEPECRSPRQMRLANALCRYREMAAAAAL